MIAQSANANAAWNAVATIATLRLTTQKIGPGTVSGFSQEDQFVQASAAAKAFYSRFPTDPRIYQARKLEVQFALQAAQFGAPSANDLATAYVDDKTVSLSDRFDVALAVETFKQAAATPRVALVDNGPAYQKIIDGLYAQFGPLPQVFDQYMTIMRSADANTATAVADEITSMPNAPASAKIEANQTLVRNALVGQSVHLKLTTLTGGTIDLSQANNSPTVVYFWGGATSGSDLSFLSAVGAAMPTGARWVYVALGGSAAPSAAAQAQAPFSGVHCYETRQFGGPVASALQINQTPYAVVIDATGKIVGFGPAKRLPALLHQAGL